jgi:putative transposase
VIHLHCDLFCALFLPVESCLTKNIYASFWIFAVAETKLIDLVDRAHHLRKVDFRGGVKHGHRDKVAEYRKLQRPSWMSKQEYMKYLDVIRIRHVP